MPFEKAHKYKLNYKPVKDIPARLLPYIAMVVRRNPRLWAFLIATDILHALRYPLSFYFMGRAVDILNTAHVQGGIPPAAWQYTGLIFITLFCGEMAHLLPHYFTFDWWKRTRAHLRADLLAYTLGHSYTYFQNNFAGALACKVSEGIEKALELNVQMRWNIMLPLVNILTSATLLFTIAPLYGLFALIFLACILTPMAFKIRKIREKAKVFSDIHSAVMGQIVDTLTNAPTVKSYAREPVELSEHQKISEREMKAYAKLLRTFLLLDNYRRMTLVFFGTFMMAACLVGWSKGLISVGNIATIMGISFNFTAVVWNMSMGIIRASESLGYVHDSLSVLITPHQVRDIPHAKDLTVTRGALSFKNVDFDYAGNAVFKGLNVDIAPHQRIGLIGHSGAGKSTFVNLIQRFFDVTGGGIVIDGQDIAQVSQESLRAHIAVIPQDTALFHRSIMDNIRYGRIDARDEDVIEAARQAHALDFIEKLPHGFDTLVGERGVKLSGGQQQRIAIARAILKNAPILILDEATSALDSESEKQIQDALAGLMKGKTVIAIAHRLSTIHHLDRLLVMEHGRIVEDGSHAALLTQNGLYQRLWAMQSGGFLPE